jgi:carboxypeptidase T
MLKKAIYIFITLGIIFGVEKYSLVIIPEITQNKITLLSQNGFDLDHGINFKENQLELVVTRSEILELNQLGINYVIQHDDLEAFYVSRLTTDLNREFENGSMGGYYTFSEVEQNLDELASECSNIISEKVSIGQSLEGRDIWMVRISDNPNSDENEPEVLYTGLHHAREPMSYMNLFYFMNYLCENYDSDEEIRNLVNNRELYFIPVVNPDGLVYNELIEPNGGGLQRKNALETCSNNNDDNRWNGIDLNRNYGLNWGYDDQGSSPDGCDQTYRGAGPFSEPETNAIKSFVEQHEFKIALNYHSYSDILIYPFGWEYNMYPTEEDMEIFTEFGTEMTQYNGYEMGTATELLYPVNGEACDWMYGEHGIIAYTPEIGSFFDGFWPPTDRIVPLAEDNLYPNKFIAFASGPFYESTSNIESGPYILGEEYFVDVLIKNRGLSNSSGDLILKIENSWEIQVELNEINLNSLNSRDEINLDQLFIFTVSENVIEGSLANLSLILHDDEGIEFKQSFDILIGVPQVLDSEEFENNENMDWFAGQLNDDATAGLWEMGVPNGTELNGVTIQPYSDHSIIGSSCFVTGNGMESSSPGYDDVDGGKTTLYSPVYNLSDYSVAFVSYWRWYNNDMSDNPGNDKWIVEVSNDGGGSWFELENTTESIHEWVNKQFVLALPEFELTSIVQFRFIAEDIFHQGDNGSGGSLVEGALDDFEISVFSDSPIVLGDVNGDQLINIVDIISVVNFILNVATPTETQAYVSDFNQSGEINILDVVAIVNLILGV